MADFHGITASSGAKVKKGKVKELRKYLKKYLTLGADCCGEEVVAEVTKTNDFGKEGKDHYLNIYGYAWLCVYEDKDYQDDITEKFLKGLAPFLAEPLIVQSVGNTKCRFPLSAWEVCIKPNGEYTENAFRLDRKVQD